MKISEVTADFAISYLRLNRDETDIGLLEACLAAAKSYIEKETGIPAQSDTDGGETLDRFEDLTLACLCLCQDLYDNRTMIPDTKYANSGNKTVESILGLHRRNLL